MNYLNRNKHIVELCGGTFGENQANKLFFPYEYIPDIIQEVFCYVAFDVGVSQSLINTTYVNLDMYFFVMCHIDKAQAEDLPGLRYDLIAQEITRDFANDKKLGSGCVQLAFNKPYVVSSEVRGRALSLGLYDVSPEAYARHAQSFI